jgi:hypothetical protein
LFCIFFEFQTVLFQLTGSHWWNDEQISFQQRGGVGGGLVAEGLDLVGIEFKLINFFYFIISFDYFLNILSNLWKNFLARIFWIIQSFIYQLRKVEQQVSIGGAMKASHRVAPHKWVREFGGEQLKGVAGFDRFPFPKFLFWSNLFSKNLFFYLYIFYYQFFTLFKYFYLLIRFKHFF